MNTDEPEATVFVVDGDATIRWSFSRALTAAGFNVRAWASAEEFLDDHDPVVPGCLVSDVALPGTSGLELQALLVVRDCIRTIVFATAEGSIAKSVQAMRAGAVSYLRKPVPCEALVCAVREAIDRDRVLRAERARRSVVESRLRELTCREREVHDLVIAGNLNKQIALRLGVSEKTIKIHRARVMSKLNVKSVAQLVNFTFEYSCDPARRSPLGLPYSQQEVRNGGEHRVQRRDYQCGRNER